MFILPTVGRKKKSRKQTKFKIKNSLVRNIVKKNKSPRLATGKRFRQFLKNYDEAIQSGDLRPIKEIEELREKWREYWNKDGSPKRSKFRSKKKQEEFNKDMREFNKKYKRWGKKAVKEIGEKQKTIREKQAKTFGENQAKRSVEEATEQGITTGVDFEQIAKEESDKYLKMLELFALDSFNKLREELNIGSRVIHVLSSMGLDESTIDSYLQDFRSAIMQIPKEARDLANEDELNKAIIDLANLHGSDNLNEVLSEYLQADSKEEQNEIAKAGEFHIKAVNNGSTKTSFKEFWSEARGTSDKKWGAFL